MSTGSASCTVPRESVPRELWGTQELSCGQGSCCGPGASVLVCPPPCPLDKFRSLTPQGRALSASFTPSPPRRVDESPWPRWQTTLGGRSSQPTTRSEACLSNLSMTIRESARPARAQRACTRKRSENSRGLAWRNTRAARKSPIAGPRWSGGSRSMASRAPG